LINESYGCWNTLEISDSASAILNECQDLISCESGFSLVSIETLILVSNRG
jgi:hypothetical protein